MLWLRPPLTAKVSWGFKYLVLVLRDFSASASSHCQVVVSEASKEQAMYDLFLLVLALATASAWPKDKFGFGFPALDMDKEVVASTAKERAPSTIEEHIGLGVDDDVEHFRNFLDLFHPKKAKWSAEMELQDEGMKLPDLKVFKYELPSLPEVNLPQPLQLPETNLPELKVVKYELPPFPAIPFPEVPALPEVKMPDLVLNKYELPAIPEVKLPFPPKVPALDLPEIRVVKYELPRLPEVKPVELPPLPEVALPQLKVTKYELPPLPEPKWDLPQIPEVELPSLKIVKYQLPQIPEVKPLWSKESSLAGKKTEGVLPVAFPKTQAVQPAPPLPTTDFEWPFPWTGFNKFGSAATTDDQLNLPGFETDNHGSMFDVPWTLPRGHGLPFVADSSPFLNWKRSDLPGLHSIMDTWNEDDRWSFHHTT